MHVERSQAGQIQQRLRQDPPVGDDHEQIGVERRQRRVRLGRAHLLRLQDRHARQAERLGLTLDRRRGRRLAAPRRAIRLTDHGDELGLGGDDAQTGDGEGRRPEEDRARARAGASRAAVISACGSA